QLNKKQKAAKGPPKMMKDNEGRWPSYAIAVTIIASKRGIVLPHELWPSNLKGLAPPARQFVTTRLMPVLEPPDKARLKAAADKWPEYPQTIDELAKKHHLQVPWQTLPGPPKLWENYR